jgi:hypothetical protein
LKYTLTDLNSEILGNSATGISPEVEEWRGKRHKEIIIIHYVSIIGS